MSVSKPILNELLITSINKKQITKNELSNGNANLSTGILPGIENSSLCRSLSPTSLNNSIMFTGNNLTKHHRNKLNYNLILNGYQRKIHEELSSLSRITSEEIKEHRKLRKIFARPKRIHRGTSAVSSLSKVSAINPPSQMTKSSSDPNLKFRKPHYAVYPIHLKKKLGFFPKIDDMRYEKCVINSVDFQKSSIIDEYTLIFDNFTLFKRDYIAGGNSFVNQIFPNMSLAQQKETNIMIEETCAMYMELPFSILGDYCNHIKEFIPLKYPKLSKYYDEKIFIEADWIQTNLRMLQDINEYSKSVLEAYLCLLAQTKRDMKISPYNFKIAQGYFERIRYNLVSLYNIAKSSSCSQESDKRFLSDLQKFETSAPLRKKKIVTDDLSQKIERILFGLVSNRSPEKEKSTRVARAIERKTIVFKTKPKPFSKDSSILRGKLMSSLLKYLKGDTKNKVLAITAKDYSV